MPEVQTDHSETAELSKPQLRMVDLNLLTVFDAVMQEQNITRAAHVLGMSQPAVSNAVARLKVMFNDELFVRYGRGIQPTARAFQLFGSVRQALQLVQNELPGSGFELMNPLMILVKIIKLRWIHILSYDQMVSRKINNQTTRCANSIF
ncbi:LysR family transcriptional regulator, partial [Escherichia coli]|uniref:LysR family transcriptional regulator n=1 Tax=Escherichia coli TaxID=562 RepID=UPI0021CC5789